MNRGPRERGKEGMPSSVASSSRSKVFGGSDDASAEHRRKLEALFGGSKASVTPAVSEMDNARPRATDVGKVFASPRKSVGRSPSEYRMRLERLRIAREPEEIREATDVFLQFHQLPDDVDILYKVLMHPAEKVVREALGQISSLLMQGRISPTMLLGDRLDMLSAKAEEEATRSYIHGIRSLIDRLKKT